MSSLFSSSAFIFIALATYLIFAYPLYVIGTKSGSDHAWFAFVPILNLVLMLEVADKDLWWILLFLIPCVNIIVAVVVWMAVAEAMDKPGWVGVLMLVPVVNWFVPWYIAFG